MKRVAQPKKNRRPRAAEVAYIANAQTNAMMSLDPLRTNFLDHARAVEASVAERALMAPTSLATRRGYTKDDLFAIAEIGYHYLENGGVRFAKMVFEGLSAVEPDEPYFALALGLASDHAGDSAAAKECYVRAAELDPGDGRPDVNTAELFIAAGDHRRAHAYLDRALAKLKHRADPALTRKAEVLKRHLGARGAHR